MNYFKELLNPKRLVEHIIENLYKWHNDIYMNIASVENEIDFGGRHRLKTEVKDMQCTF